MIKKIISLSVFTFILSTSLTAFANNTGLNKAQLKKLKSIDVPLILPNYIPAGFKAERVDAVKEKRGGPGEGSNYFILYTKKLTNGKKSGFSIVTTTGGIGDLMQNNPVIIKTKLGDVFVHIDSLSEPNNIKLKNCIDMEWLEYKDKRGNINFYRFSSGSGCRITEKGDDGSSQRVSKEEAFKIINSFQVIK